MSDIRFRGLPLNGTPLVFDREPAEDAGYLVFLTEDQFRKAKKAGLDLRWLRPWDKGDHAYYIMDREPS